MADFPKLIASIAFLSPLLGWRAERRYRQMPALGDGAPDEATGALPSLSIIVPARNEERNLQQLLPSLRALQYPGKLELIVVDDNSTDNTAVIAAEQGATVLSLKELPDGWLGKPHACHRGTAVASGDWLLFTDADTIHAPHGVARAVAYALTNRLDGLTCHLAHKTTGLLDSLTLTAAFAALFAGLGNDHASLNGQYILLRRDVYEGSGGFTAVRNEPLEDLALGRRLHTLGYRVPMLRGEAAAQVEMYQSAGHLWQGMARLGAGALRWSGVGSLITALFITALMTPFLTLTLALTRRLPARWFFLSWITAVGGALPWAGRFGSPQRIFLIPVGALVVQLSALWGLFSRLIGRGFSWKGRKV